MPGGGEDTVLGSVSIQSEATPHTPPARRGSLRQQAPAARQGTVPLGAGGVLRAELMCLAVVQDAEVLPAQVLEGITAARKVLQALEDRMRAW
ncbi:hypothetical protein GCM10023329_02270 [Streptomyces sanyensis]|uniref:Uncharacterized protein n=1 Tax=Streptomyces sanyensis TaxID=568869 RepID=A0ABP8ZN90_9ACTN